LQQERIASAVGTQLDAANVRRALRGVVKAAGWTRPNGHPGSGGTACSRCYRTRACRWSTSPGSSATAGRPVTEAVYRKQIRPVLTEGAETMDRIFSEPRDPEASTGA
jgi:hypothetical protein